MVACRWWVSIVCALGGCFSDRVPLPEPPPCTPPDPVWRFELGTAPFDHPWQHVRAAADGSFVVLVSYPEPVLIGGVLLQGPHLLRLDSSGNVVKTAAVADVGSGILQLLIDDTGAPMIDATRSNQKMFGYDRDFTQTWSLMPNVGDLVVDVGPSGSVAFLEGNNAGGSNLKYLDATGALSWRIPVRQGHTKLRITGSGDVFAYEWDTPTQRLLYSVSGTRVEETSLSLVAGWWFIGEPVYERDGGLLMLDPISNDEPTGVARYRAGGAPAWFQALSGQTSSPIFGTNGDVLVVDSDVAVSESSSLPDILLGVQVARLDGATGEIRSAHSHCANRVTLISADATGYVLQHASKPASARPSSPEQPGYLARYAPQ